MATFAQRLDAATRLLEDISETPRLDAEILMAHAIGKTRAQLLARLRENCCAPRFDELLQRRKAHEPLAYILGEWEFYSLTLTVRPPLLVPRPETEHLVEAVLEHIGGRHARILELCTGTGCVSVALACSAPNTRIIATDINPGALACLQENTRRHGVQDRIAPVKSDLFNALPEERPESRFDVICANPPYVESDAWDSLDPVIRLYEDPRALLAGPDGLDLIRRLVEQAPRHLKPGGLLAFEMGMGQYEQVKALLNEHGYEDIDIRRDLARIERVALAYTPKGKTSHD